MGNRPDTQCNYVNMSEIDSCKSNDLKLSGVSIANQHSNLTLACFIRATWLSSTHIVCTTPPFKRGSVSVEVTTNDFDYTTDRVQFKYRSMLELNSLYPQHGNQNGGTEITLSGSKFEYSSSLSCKFNCPSTGRSINMPATFLSEKQVRCTTPHWPLSPPDGLTSISILSNGADESSNSLFFEYAHLPVVSYIVPSSGQISGGSNITIIGEYFRHASELSCRFGGEFIVPAVFLNVTKISCISPPLSQLSREGDVLRYAVHVSTNGKDFSLSASDFWYETAPMITSVLPTNGPFDGGTSIRVFGNGFLGAQDLHCIFGDISSNARFINSNMIMCRTPDMRNRTNSEHTSNMSTSLLSVSIRVGQNGIRSAKSDVAFNYVLRPLVTSLKPKFGFVGSPTVVIATSEIRGHSSIRRVCKCMKPVCGTKPHPVRLLHRPERASSVRQ